MLEIVPVISTDVDTLVAIEQLATPYPWSRALFESCLQSSYLNYALRHDGQLIGYYFAQRVLDELTLFNITIAPKYQGKGFGRELVQHIIQQARKYDCLQIWLEVRASNQSAIALYRSAGFQQSGVRKGYYQNTAGQEDAVVMQYTVATSTIE